MGRLTLNVLLSFAQFEREVTGERIRDKITASKRRGMWMGGNIPLGYDVIQRRLVTNEPEAKSVRYIFETYVALGTVAKLEAAVRQTQIMSKVWISSRGNKRGGNGYSRGALYYLLRNPVYVGLIPHKGELYPAKHAPIISRELWDQVQAGLRENRPNAHRLPAKQSQRPLAGLLYDDRGNIMSPSFTKKRDGRRYPCYVSQAILQNRKHIAGSIARIPAEPIEKAVYEHAKPLIAKRAPADGIGAGGLNAILRETVGRVVLSKDGIEIVGVNSTRRLMVPGVIIRRGRSLTFESFEKRPSSKSRRPTTALVKAICRASAWREKCDSGEIKTYYDLARFTGFVPSYVRSNMQLAFLAPDVVEAIIDNRRTLCDGVVKLTTSHLPLSWHRQLALLSPREQGDAGYEG
jgi:site-specific DNA recombinase